MLPSIQSEILTIKADRLTSSNKTPNGHNHHSIKPVLVPIKSSQIPIPPIIKEINKITSVPGIPSLPPHLDKPLFLKRTITIHKQFLIYNRRSNDEGVLSTDGHDQTELYFWEDLD
jgi:hypothetical protein